MAVQRQGHVKGLPHLDTQIDMPDQGAQSR